VELKVSVTVTQVGEDGSERPVDGELAAALAGPAGQFGKMVTWAARDAGAADHGDRETVIAKSGRELQRQLLESTFTIDSKDEEQGRIEQVTSAAGIRHGTAEKGHDRGVASIFGPVRATRLAYRNRREANLYPADARWMLPDDPYSLGMRALVAYHLSEGGYGQAADVIAARTGVKIGPAQLAQIAADLAAWTGDFYEQRAAGADLSLPASDVIMFQADGKGIAMRPEYRKGEGETDAAHPGIKKMAEVVAVADFTPAVREPEDIAAPKARRKEHPGPVARGKWVAASITETIEGMIGAAYDEGDRRDPLRSGSGCSSSTGTSSRSPPSAAMPRPEASKCRCSSISSTSPAISARPPPRCTPATPGPPASGPTGRNCGSCTAAPGPSPPPWHPSLPGPAPRPAPGTSTSPTWTRPSPT
jgi:hypothetical protein